MTTATATAQPAPSAGRPETFEGLDLSVLGPFTPEPIDHGAAIVVADRGHVWFARGAVTQGDFTTLTAARVIRRWGTTEGLNQLAAGGPRGGTVMDAPADLKVLNRAIIYVIPCEAAQWPA